MTPRLSGFIRGVRKAAFWTFALLDVSGDGKNNAGAEPQAILDVTINGLPICGAEYGLPLYFEATLISGPGAFVEPAADYADFTRAMTRKLVRETGTPEIGALE